MNAGSIHGVTEDAQFALYPSREFSADDAPFMIMLASAVAAFGTELSLADTDAPAPTLPSPCFAFQISMGTAEALRLHVPFSEDLSPVVEALAEELQSEQETGRPFILLGDREQVHLIVQARDGQIEYLIGDALLNTHGMYKLYHMTPADARFIRPVLRTAAHFFWHLHRSPMQTRLRDKVAVEVYKLHEDVNGPLDENLLPPFVPIGENILHAGTVDAVVDDGLLYGVKVRNRTTVPMHVWAFYFDCSDLSICTFFSRSSAPRQSVN